MGHHVQHGSDYGLAQQTGSKPGLKIGLAQPGEHVVCGKNEQGDRVNEVGKMCPQSAMGRKQTPLVVLFGNVRSGCTQKEPFLALLLKINNAVRPFGFLSDFCLASGQGEQRWRQKRGIFQDEPVKIYGPYIWSVYMQELSTDKFLLPLNISGRLAQPDQPV